MEQFNELVKLLLLKCESNVIFCEEVKILFVNNKMYNEARILTNIQCEKEDEINSKATIQDCVNAVKDQLNTLGYKVASVEVVGDKINVLAELK